MLEISIDDEKLKAVYEAELKRRLDEIEKTAFFLTFKDLCRYTKVSNTTVYDLFLSDPEFPVIRVGVKMLFPKKEVDAYLEKWVKEVIEDHGGHARASKNVAKKILMTKAE
ncbi:helix-turn-helix transcriptional regulator [Domibacillus tundrae]|uniref:helix-turn-helix transcriptional regulator n=1 Tax=Domibacillus tundrae TaxID=1587527 RepID=UPI000697B4A4|nr:helix-turn-helix domain-containing protein [Domibacillus tundrae]